MPHALLDELERQAKDDTAEMEALWDTPAFREWLCLDPPFARVDLRGALYISREHAPIILNAAELSAAGRAVLEEMLARIGRADAHRESLLPLPAMDRALIKGALLDKARREPPNAFPEILTDCLVVAALDEEVGQRLILYLKSHAEVRARLRDNLVHLAAVSPGRGVGRV